MARPASDNTTAVWKFLRGKGLTSAQAAGIIGVMQQESGQGLNPGAVNPSSGATGIAQWLGGRKNAAVMSKQLGPQLQHLWSELQGPERGALQAVKGAHTIEDATRAWLMKFERPGANEMVLGRRIANARNVFSRLSGVGGSASTPGGGGSSGGGGGGGTRTTTTTTPGVDNSLARLALVQSFLGNKNSDVLDFAAQAKGLADVPGTTSTRTERLPGQGGIGGGSAGSSASFGAGKGPAGRRSPVAHMTSEGGQHPTAGLAGFPARDYFAHPGTAAVAPVNGRVVRLSGHDPAQGPTQGPHGPLGYSVYIKGDDGHEYFLTHMGTRNVKPGQRVRSGQKIGTVANYDKYGTPSHIHMGVR
jgi:murein DD-endopeptidase MepM/ murein hydrolase activator NlpD